MYLYLVLTGNFENAIISVYGNNLTRFDESVFGPVWQQKALESGSIMADKGIIIL